MKMEMTHEVKDGVRGCLHHFLKLARKLRDGADVTEDLKEEFERERFNPVCLLREMPRRPIRQTCQLCNIRNRRSVAETEHELKAYDNLESAVEYYLALGGGVVENQKLMHALKQVIEIHWDLIHRPDASSHSRQTKQHTV